MDISEVRVKLTSNQSDRVRAFCSVTFDREFVVRDIKVIEGTSGLFVAMPSRKISDHCQKCRGKNHLRAKFCNDCGTKLRENRAPRNGSGRSKLHADIAHPINMACRERLQAAILEAYGAELERSKQPGYQPPRLDAEDEFDNGAEYAALIAELRGQDSEDHRPGVHSSEADEPEPTREGESVSGGDGLEEPGAEAPDSSDRPEAGGSTRGREFGKGIL